MSELDDDTTQAVSLVSRWFVRSGCEDRALAAISVLAEAVQSGEPDTLMYLVHVACEGDLQSLPPSEPRLILFFETYRNREAFERHVSGAIFTGFVREHGALFVPNSQGSPYTTVEFLTRRAGFIRPEAAQSKAANQHPAVMFEVIAKDQAAAKRFYSAVFGWAYADGAQGFSYVHFPVGSPPLLGGIGQANSAVPGFEPGRNFYVLVDNVETYVARAIAAGGKQHMPPASADGYRFAMIADPEGNPVGLIEPFAE